MTTPATTAYPFIASAGVVAVVDGSLFPDAPDFDVQAVDGWRSETMHVTGIVKYAAGRAVLQVERGAQPLDFALGATVVVLPGQGAPVVVVSRDVSPVGTIIVGEQGPQGVKGDKGDTGDAGPQGVPSPLEYQAILPPSQQRTAIVLGEYATLQAVTFTPLTFGSVTAGTWSDLYIEAADHTNTLIGDLELDATALLDTPISIPVPHNAYPAGEVFQLFSTVVTSAVTGVWHMVFTPA
jgi:hypothetical protein